MGPQFWLKVFSILVILGLLVGMTSMPAVAAGGEGQVVSVTTEVARQPLWWCVWTNGRVYRSNSEVGGCTRAPYRGMWLANSYIIGY